MLKHLRQCEENRNMRMLDSPTLIIFIARYSEKIMKFADNIYNIGVKMTKCHEDKFNVINHGDCWVNNMLFKYDDNGKPIDHIFVSRSML